MKLYEHKKQLHNIRDVNELHDEQLTFADRTSDSVASYVGSWRFVLLMTSLLIVWLAWNSISFLPHFDPAPFILLNLCLSFLAGYTAPFIMMSQNRASAKDRLTAEEDYKINRKGEQEIEQMIEHLCKQDEQIIQANQELMKQTAMLVQLLQSRQ